jgi:hypothetical protein
VTPSEAAAWLKLRCWAAATNARNIESWSMISSPHRQCVPA